MSISVTASVYDIIRQPVVTEKSTLANEQNKITFKVLPDASKNDVKKAVESIFNVKVSKVNILNVKGKEKIFRGRKGKRSGVRKAIVTLAQGQNIDMTAGV